MSATLFDRVINFQEWTVRSTDFNGLHAASDLCNDALFGIIDFTRLNGVWVVSLVEEMRKRNNLGAIDKHVSLVYGRCKPNMTWRH